VTFHYNADEDSIDLGGIFFGQTKKWRDAGRNPKVTLLVDDVIGPPRRARAIEIRGTVERHESGGERATPASRTSSLSSSVSGRPGSWPGGSKTSRPARARDSS